MGIFPNAVCCALLFVFSFSPLASTFSRSVCYGFSNLGHHAHGTGDADVSLLTLAKATAHDIFFKIVKNVMARSRGVATESRRLARCEEESCVLVGDPPPLYGCALVWVCA